MITELNGLRQLAALHRVQTSYIDMHGRRCPARRDALLALMQGLGVPLSNMRDLGDATRAHLNELGSQWVSKVLVAWDGDSGAITIRVPMNTVRTHAIGPRLQYTLRLENGDVWSGNVTVDQTQTLRHLRCADGVSAVKSFLPRKALPFGYHNLTVLIGQRAFQSLVISAPTRSYQSNEAGGREWGVFAPIYALNTTRNWGVGDFTDAGVLASWVGEQGGSMLGTLPFLASFLDTPCDPSPYTPVSRLFWNELFVDPTILPELSGCVEAQELIGSSAFRTAVRLQQESRLIDYAGAARLKRDVLQMLSSQLATTRGERYDLVRRFAETHPELVQYARFRALTRGLKTVWSQWPATLRERELSEVEGFRDDEFYHLYCQFAANEQVEGLARRCTSANVSLYLDYPLGVHADGFDAWRHQSLFAHDLTAGAPPDPVFTTGQDWGFHPVLPTEQRRDGYRYLRASLRHHMRHAGMLRIDHVMGLHRLYCIPKGFHKSEGMYVRYPANEIYAVLSLESHQSQTVLVGENLGIVPGYVTQSMKRHGFAGMNVAYWEMAADPDGAMRRLAQHSDVVACLNTHDMFPFAAFWHALDADKRQDLGMITSEQADLERWVRGELRHRLTDYLRQHEFEMTGEGDTVGALRGMLALLARSDARWLLITLEDLWLETSPQNIPDTVNEHPNWRQKARVSLEELMRDAQIMSLLKAVQDGRDSAGGGTKA